MKVDFGEIINFSFKQTVSILFRPFNFKKWLALGLAALLSGQLSLGGNSSGGKPSSSRQNIKQTSSRTSDFRFQPAHHTDQKAQVIYAIAADQPEDIFVEDNLLKGIKDIIPFKVSGTIIILGLLILIIVIPLLIWISSIFYFVFLENIIKNEANIKKPFLDNRHLGTSYFQWNILFGAGIILILASLATSIFLSLKKAGLLDNIKDADMVKIISLIAPYMFTLLPIILISILITWIVRDFVLPIMLKENIGIIKSFKKALPCLKENLKEVIIYLLISVGIGIVASIVAFIFVIIIMLIVLLIAGILFLIYKILPGIMQDSFRIIVTPLGVIIFVFLYLAANLSLLPIPVFFRLFNLKFLGEIDKRYDLLTKTP